MTDLTMETSLAILLGLGALHGINPAMGWLFAVGLGLQEEDRRAVWRALGPMALGHAMAIAVVVGLAVALGLVIPTAALEWIVACLLAGLGIFHLARHRHPRWGGMRVGRRDLVIWSFLLASAHGAGLMVLPFLPAADTGAAGEAAEVARAAGATGATGATGAAPVAGAAAPARSGTGRASSGHAGHAAGDASAGGALAPHAAHGPRVLAAQVGGGPVVGLLATLVHTLGYLLATGLIAVLVYEKLGLRRLRSVWVNLDAAWAAALVLTAVAVVAL